jgi:hypothetical protein
MFRLDEMIKKNIVVRTVGAFLCLLFPKAALGAWRTVGLSILKGCENFRFSVLYIESSRRAVAACIINWMLDLHATAWLY